MKNKIKKTKKSGFTLVETIIVISIFSIIASVTFVMLNGTRNEVVLEDAQATVLNALESARSRAATGVGNVGNENHGVRINENEIVVLEGTIEKPPISLPAGVFTDQSGLEIIFNRLSPNVNIAGDTVITLTHIISGLTKTITITPNGRIIK